MGGSLHGNRNQQIKEGVLVNLLSQLDRLRDAQITGETFLHASMPGSGRHVHQ